MSKEAQNKDIKEGMLLLFFMLASDAIVEILNIRDPFAGYIKIGVLVIASIFFARLWFRDN